MLMIIFLSITYYNFFFSKTFINKIIFFFLFYLFTVFFFFCLKKNIFAFLLLLINASALLILLIFILISVDIKEKPILKNKILIKFKNSFYIKIIFFLKFLYCFHYFKWSYSIFLKKNLYSLININSNLLFSLSDLQELGFLMYNFFFLWVILLSIFLTFLLIICLNLILKRK